MTEKKKYSVAFVVEFDFTEEEYEQFVNYDDEPRKMLKKELCRQVDNCEYIGGFNADREEMYRRLFNN